MDRRTLLKSGLFAGLLTITQRFSTAQNITKTPPLIQDKIVPTAERPLLLNFNENSLGMSPKAQQVIIDSLSNAFRYPDDPREQLIQQIAALHRVSPDHVTLGNGSSETIQAAVQSLGQMAVKQKKSIQLIVPDPTFNYAETYAKSIDIPVVKVPLQEKTLAFDLKKMAELNQNFKGISLVYLCNPNNPTAVLTASDALLNWMKSAPDTFFIIDEAYAEYVQDPHFISATEAVKAGLNNVLVVRTFSKIHALAGLRIGYGIGNSNLIQRVNDFVSFDNTNIAAAVAASASLKDSEFIEQSLKATALSRQLVVDALDELNLTYVPSHGNFIFHKVPGTVKAYQDNMKQAHIFVGREFPPATGWSRLTLGTPAEMTAFIAVLKEFRAKGLV